LQQEFKDNLHKQVADMSLEMLGDSSEINELRAEIAGLRAELVQLRAQAKGNSKLTV
jgi:ribosomal protein L29